MALATWGYLWMLPEAHDEEKETVAKQTNMTDSSDISCTCPRCHAHLNLRHNDAGKRVQCPSCQGTVKVPDGHASSAQQSRLSPGGGGLSAHSAAEALGRGTQIVLVCPQCRTTLSAAIDQIGQEIVCSECLEGVPVVAQEAAGGPLPGDTVTGAVRSEAVEETHPHGTASLVDREAAPAANTSPTAAKTSPTSVDRSATPAEPEQSLVVPDDPLAPSPSQEGTESGASPAGLDGVDETEDDLVLAPAEELGAILPDIMDSIKAAEARSDAHFGGPHADSEAGSTEPAPKGADQSAEFGYSCTLCGTRLHARPNQSGQTMKCPDCFVENIVPQPPAKPKQPVREDATEDFGLGEARQPTFPGAAVNESLGMSPHQNAQKMLAAAEAELASEYEEEAEFDAEPPMNLMVSFLVDPSALLTAVFGGVSFGLWLCCIVRAFSPDTMTRVVGIMGTLATSVLSLLALAFLLAACLAIVTETSAGNRKITGWPSSDVSDWLFSVLTLFNPLWMSGLPGFVLGAMISMATGGGGGFVLVFLSWLALFPVVMHAMNENESSFMPYSSETVRSIQKHPRQWGMFYASATFLMLFCSLVFCGLISTSAWGGAWVTNTCGCVVLVTVMMIYCRLFGWHIWRLNELDTGAYLNRVAGEGLYDEVK